MDHLGSESASDAGESHPHGDAGPEVLIADLQLLPVTAFAFKGDLDVDAVKGKTFEMECPPKPKDAVFPEIDRGGWFDLSAAHANTGGQRPLLGRMTNRRCQIENKRSALTQP